MPRAGAQTFSDFLPDFRIVVGCTKCDRKGSYRVASVMARKGDVRLTDFVDDVSADCPKHGSHSIYDLCGCRFMNLEQGRRPDPEWRDTTIGAGSAAKTTSIFCSNANASNMSDRSQPF